MRRNRLYGVASVLILIVLCPLALSQQTGSIPIDVKEKPRGWYLKPDCVQREVTFKTEDGWSIYGTYTIPRNYTAGNKLPAALLLHASMHSQTAWQNYVGWVKVENVIPTLRIDIRGRGKSQGAIPFQDFSQKQREKVALDVAAALDFLAAQKEVDSTRIGIAVEELTASPAIKAAMEDPRVRAFVLLSAVLDQKDLDLIASDLNKPILYVVSKEDRESFDSVTKAYNLDKTSDSEIWVENGLGVGLTMGSNWRNKYTDQPLDKAIDCVEGEWLLNKLRSYGRLSEVTVHTKDGWTLYANLRLPYEIEEGKTVPGVILLPTALVDRSSFSDFERVLVSNGIAVLDLEWRGIGKSTGKGNYIDLPLSEIIKAPQDVIDGYSFLASQKGVDPERIGVLGSALAAKIALYAAKDNPKLKAVAMLTPIVWPWEQESDAKTITSLDRPVLLVTGDGFGEMTKHFAKLVESIKRDTVITYPGGIFGYLLFTKVDRSLERTTALWLKDQLAGTRKEQANATGQQQLGTASQKR